MRWQPLVARLTLCVSTVAPLNASVRLAAAQTGPASSDVAATARALFKQGRALLEAKDYSGAAAKFEESFRLDPGGGTKLNLALSYELAGRTASAWAAFSEALGMARIDRRADRVDEAETHLRQLESRLSRLRVVVPEISGAPGMEIRRDGIVLGEASWNVAIPVDPGQHQIAASARGKRPWLVAVTVGDDGDREDVTVKLLQDEAEPRSPASVARTLGWGSLAIGGAGLLAGSAAGVVVLIENAQLGQKADCADLRCGPGERSLADQYNAWRTVAALGFWVGGGLAATGIVLLLTIPRPVRTNARIWLSPTTMGLAGIF